MIRGSAPTYASDLAAATPKIQTSLRERNDRGIFSDGRRTQHVSAAGETARNDFAEAMPEKAQVTSHSLVWFAAAIKGRGFHRRI